MGHLLANAKTALPQQGIAASRTTRSSQEQENLQSRLDAGCIVSFPRAERKRVQESVQHLAGNGFHVRKSQHHIHDPRLEGAIFTGNTHWATIVEGLNGTTGASVNSMLTKDYLDPEAWNIFLGEGTRIDPASLGKLFGKGNYMRCGPRSYRVGPTQQFDALKDSIAGFNELRRKSNQATNPRYNRDYPILCMYRGSEVHWFGAPRRPTAAPWSTSPSMNAQGLQGYVLIGAHPTINTDFLTSEMKVMGISVSQIMEAQWFCTLRQEHAIQLYAAPGLDKAGPHRMDGMVFTLLPLSSWHQARRLEGPVVDARPPATPDEIRSRLRAATANLPKEQPLTEDQKQQVEHATQAKRSAINKKAAADKRRKAQEREATKAQQAQETAEQALRQSTKTSPPPVPGKRNTEPGGWKTVGAKQASARARHLPAGGQPSRPHDPRNDLPGGHTGEEEASGTPNTSKVVQNSARKRPRSGQRKITDTYDEVQGDNPFQALATPTSQPDPLIVSAHADNDDAEMDPLEDAAREPPDLGERRTKANHPGSVAATAAAQQESTHIFNSFDNALSRSNSPQRRGEQPRSRSRSPPAIPNAGNDEYDLTDPPSTLSSSGRETI